MINIPISVFLPFHKKGTRASSLEKLTGLGSNYNGSYEILDLEKFKSFFSKLTDDQKFDILIESVKSNSDRLDSLEQELKYITERIDNLKITF